MTLALFSLITLVACGDKDDDTGDTGAPGDGGTMDGGTGDGGTDGGGTDGGGTDGGGITDGGGTGDGGTAADDLEIAGTWTDSWGGGHTITNELWDQGYASFQITQYDNDAMYVIARNDSANKWNPDQWSRFDWAWDGTGGLWYCQSAYDAASEADALATPAADPADPATGGCGGFSWTGMSPM